MRKWLREQNRSDVFTVASFLGALLCVLAVLLLWHVLGRPGDWGTALAALFIVFASGVYGAALVLGAYEGLGNQHALLHVLYRREDCCLCSTESRVRALEREAATAVEPAQNKP